MKTCEICAVVHDRIGHRTCGAQKCLSELLKRKKRNAARHLRHQVMTDLGLRRVKGNLGGTYYE